MTDTDELREDFDYNDVNGDGRLDRAEFGRLMANLDSEATRQEVDIGFDEIDSDDDGFIEFEEFVEWWDGR